MKITLCGSMTFFEEMSRLKPILEDMGFEKVYLPIGISGDNAKAKDKMTV